MSGIYSPNDAGFGKYYSKRLDCDFTFTDKLSELQYKYNIYLKEIYRIIDIRKRSKYFTKLLNTELILRIAI